MNIGGRLNGGRFNGGRFSGFADGGFDPLLLFVSGEEGVLFDKMNPADGYLYQDSALTTLCTAAGDPVGGMVDRSGNGNDALQSVNADFRPTVEQDGSGNWYLDFDGVDDWVGLGTFIFPSNFSFCLAYDTDADLDELFLASNSSTPWGVIHESGGTSTSLTDFTPGTEPTLAFYVDGTLRSVTTRGDIHTEISGNHVQIWDATGMIQISESWRIGGYPGAANFQLAGRLYGFLWREQLSVTERGSLTQYFANLSGVTL